MRARVARSLPALLAGALVVAGAAQAARFAEPPSGLAPVATTVDNGNGIRVDEGDNGGTVTLTRGMRLHVVLGAPGVGGVWVAPQAPNGLWRERVRTDSSGLRATFQAVEPTSSTGSQLGIGSDDTCHHSQPSCAKPQQVWSITVIVQAASSTASPAPSPSPAPKGPVPPATRTVGESDHQTTVALRPGDTLAFDLTPYGGGARRNLFAPSDLLFNDVLQIDESTAVGRLIALREGSADVYVGVDQVCFHTSPMCAAEQQPWTVHVVISETPDAAPTITAAVNVSTITAGNTPTISGRYNPGATAGPANPTLALWGKTHSGPWQQLTTVTPASDGRYVARVQPFVQSAFLVRGGGADSPTRVIRVHARVTLTSDGDDEASPVTVRGGTLPAISGMTVGIAAYDSSGRYAFVRRLLTTDGGAFAGTARLPLGRIRLVVYVPPRPGLLQGVHVRSIYVNPTAAPPG